MVRSLPFPSPFADVDGKRIAANTFVVILHVLAFALMLMPAQMRTPDVVPREMTVVPIPIPERPIKETKPPPEDKPRIVRPEPRPQPVPQPTVAEAPADDAPVFETGELQATIPGDAGPPAETFDTGPGRAELALDVAPAPKYPRTSMRKGEQGTVVLRVLVDAEGRPQEVTIETSSGHRDLDRAARDTVLQRWKFHAAQRDGRAVSAWGLVPVRFTLPD